jgi:5-deoxy-glucuronate isomerase
VSGRREQTTGKEPHVQNVISPGNGVDLITLDVAEIEEGDALLLSREGETLVVLFSGVVDVDVDGQRLGSAGGRGSVFEGPGDAIYAPPDVTIRLRASTRARIAIASAPLADLPPGKARIITPSEQDIAERGEGNWARTVRTILGPDDEAGRLLVGETINPPGNWSSYPPHKHDQHNPPHEVQLEEVYLFKVDPTGGFGIQLLYDGHGEKAFVVRDGDIAAIRSGYHPVVAAPGYSLYYLWVMAGRGRQMRPALDPAHAWVQLGR